MLLYFLHGGRGIKDCIGDRVMILFTVVVPSHFFRPYSSSSNIHTGRANNHPQSIMKQANQSFISITSLLSATTDDMQSTDIVHKDEQCAHHVATDLGAHCRVDDSVVAITTDLRFLTAEYVSVHHVFSILRIYGSLCPRSQRLWRWIGSADMRYVHVRMRARPFG
jgi:hypothetical protein